MSDDHEQRVQAKMAQLIACAGDYLRLRFGRTYEKGIRPHAAYCEESITLVDEPSHANKRG
jgi:hypothetical protein